MPPLAVRHLQRFLPTTKWDRDSKTITIVDSPDNISKALKEAMFHDSHYQEVLEVYMELHIGSFRWWQQFSATLVEFLLLLPNCTCFTLTHAFAGCNTGMQHLPMLVIEELIRAEDLSSFVQQFIIVLDASRCPKSTWKHGEPVQEDVEITELDLDFGVNLRWDVFHHTSLHQPSQYVIETAGRRSARDAYAVWRIQQGKLVVNADAGATPAVDTQSIPAKLPPAVLEELNALKRQVDELSKQSKLLPQVLEELNVSKRQVEGLTEQLASEQNRAGEVARRFECSVCVGVNGERDTVLIPCGHTCCLQCAVRLSVCHVCRAFILLPLRMYI